jgi:hypothetical protein
MDEHKKKMLIIGGVVLILAVIIISTVVMINHKKNIQNIPTHSSTSPPLTTALYKLATRNIKGEFVGGTVGTVASSKNGYYLENKSNKNIINVRLKLYNASSVTGIRTYTVDINGGSMSEWGTYLQTTPVAGTNNRMYTGTYDIPCLIIPGGAFIVNTSEISVGGVNFNTVTFD